MTEITSRQLILDAFENKAHSRYPIWFMRQAGRYLPEYMKIRNNMTFEERVQTPDIAKQITLQPIERFDLDAAIIFSDILVPLYHLNVGLSIIPEVGPVLKHPFDDLSDVDKFKSLEAENDYSYLPESIKLVREEIPEKALIGFSGAPFTLASYMIEGKSTRNALKTKTFALNSPQKFDRLMSFLTDTIIDQLKSQVSNGVDLIQVFDSWAGFLNPEQFREWSLPYLKRIFSEFQAIPTILYARGSSHLISEITKSGARGYGIDPSIDIVTASDIIGNQNLIQGNLDPVYLLASPKIVESKTKAILEKMDQKQRNNYIFNLGIGIDRSSNLDSVYSMINTVKSFERVN